MPAKKNTARKKSATKKSARRKAKPTVFGEATLFPEKLAKLNALLDKAVMLPR